MPIQLTEEWFQSHQETSDGLAVLGPQPVRRLGIQRPPTVGERPRLDRGLAQGHRRLFPLVVYRACVVVADPGRGGNTPVRRCARPQKMASAHFAVIATLAIRPWNLRSTRSCRVVGESMVPTMKSDLHENRHEILHGWRKIKEFFRRSKNALGPLRFTYEVFWLVKGFMIPTVKG